MRAGPKTAPRLGALDISKLPRQRAARAIAFIEHYCRTPKGKGARKYMKLRPWQRQIVRRVFAPGVRQGLVTMPRGNGKTTLAAALALYGLFADNVEGAQVLCVASDERQARHTFNAARRMVELNDDLAERVQVFQDRIYLPATDSTLMPLPADAGALQGFDPTLAVVDELHVVNEETWDAMALAAGKRERSLVLALSTAADEKDSVMWRLVEHGRAGDDKQFAFIEFAAPEGCETADEDAWQTANPALGDFLSIDALRATLKTTREENFRRYRLNQWVGRVGAWLPFGLWETRAADRIVGPGEQIVMAFDGSASGDSTALVGATLDGFVFRIGLWENPGDERWRVPRAEVDRIVDEGFDRYEVLELACDPFGWRAEIEAWVERHGERVIEFPTNGIPRMAPATDRFYAAVAEDNLSHDGDADFARHVTNCVAKSTQHGDVVVKDRRGSPRKIDLAVAAIVAFERASWHANQPRKRRRVVAW